MASKPYTILIVDDEPDTLESLREVVESVRGASVHLAQDGTRALKLMETTGVDLVIADYRMPGMSGLELLHKIRARQPSVDRVLITAYADLQIALRAINEGRVKRFFTKPLEPQEVIDVVRELRAARRSRVDRSRAFARGLDTLRRGPRGGRKGA